MVSFLKLRKTTEQKSKLHTVFFYHRFFLLHGTFIYLSIFIPDSYFKDVYHFSLDTQHSRTSFSPDLSLELESLRSATRGTLIRHQNVIPLAVRSGGR